MMMIIIIIISWLILITYKKNINPASVMLFIWTVFVTLAVFFYDYGQIYYEGLIYIITCCLIFLLCYSITGGKRNLTYNKLWNAKDVSIYEKKSYINMLYFIAVFAEVILIILSLKRYGYSMAMLRNLFAVASNVYHSEYGTRSIIDKISHPIILSVISIDGYVFSCYFNQKEKHRSVFPILLVGVLIQCTLSTRKSFLIWSLIFWLSGFLCNTNIDVIRLRNKKPIYDFVKRNKKLTIGICSFFILSIVLLMQARGIKSGTTLADRIKDYSLGQLSSFSSWFHFMKNDNLQYSRGKQTLYSLFNTFEHDEGLSSNWPLNVYSYSNGIFTNVYTLFRGMIEDFGVAGCCLCWVGLGVICGIAQSFNMIFFYTSKVVLYVFYIFCFFSFIISPFHYLSVCIAIIFFDLELFVLLKMRFIER